MPITIIILLLVLAAIIFRNFITINIPIWMIMVAGAVAALIFQQISVVHALKAIEPDVIFYLLGVFLICQAAEESGYLEQLTDRLFFHTQTGAQALFVIIFLLGISSALLMNDTIAIVGTPIILQLCKSHPKLTKPLLLALAFAVTIGSVISAVGNPQNLLIAVKSDMPNPFISFIKLLTIPTIINLVIAYFFVKIAYGHVLNEAIEKPVPCEIKDHRTVLLVKISLGIMLILFGVKIFADYFHSPLSIDFGVIALLAAVPILFSKQRWLHLKHLDWGTLIFFASMFILMQSVWDSGFFQASIQHWHIAVTHIYMILTISVVLSQFISNVPLVALYLPLLLHQNLPESHFLALAAGSTIAGNLSILGAASNIIIVQNAEKRGNKGFSFFDFIKIGLPLTLVNILVYGYFLR